MVGVLENRNYDPYGELFGAMGSSETSYGFTGEPMDDNGLLYLRNRYMNPALGQFISLDPLETPNRYAYVSGNPINRVDPTGLFDWCTGQIQQGDWLFRIAQQGSQSGASEAEITTTMNRIMAANPIITNPNYIGFTWQPLNIPADIKAWGQVNTGTSCSTASVSSNSQSCNCETGYVWKADWHTCVPIISPPPPPIPYVEYTMDMLYQDYPCIKYYDVAASLGVYDEAAAASTTGRFPHGVNLPRETELYLYGLYNTCILDVFDKTGFQPCDLAGPAATIILDVATLFPGTSLVATAVLLLIGAVQVLSNPSDLEMQQSLNRTLGGTLTLSDVQTFIGRVGGETVRGFAQVVGVGFTIGDIAENIKTITDGCFSD